MDKQGKHGKVAFLRRVGIACVLVCALVASLSSVPGAFWALAEEGDTEPNTGGTASVDPSASGKQVTDQNFRSLAIRAVDEKGDAIPSYRVMLQRSLDARVWYDVDPESEGQYQLELKDERENLWVTYRFTIMAAGYSPYEGTKFTFGRVNAYFDPSAQLDPVTITVHLSSTDSTLRKAKDKAIAELKSYKDRSSYRAAEQEKLDTEIASGTERIEAQTTTSGVEWALGVYKERLDRLKTAYEYESEEYRDRIYFQSDDGKTIVRPDKYGIVSITTTDSGNFHVMRPDGSEYANDDVQTHWRCVWQYTERDHGSIAWNVIVGSYGQYAGKFAGTYDATVELRDIGRTISFKVRVIDAHIDKLRVFFDGVQPAGGVLHVRGSERKHATVEGRLGGTDRWVAVPYHALNVQVSGSSSYSTATEQVRTWGTTGKVVYSLEDDRAVKATVQIRATIVHPTGLKVKVPKVATVGDWDGVYGRFVGIREGDGEGYYRVKVTPDNTSNPSVTWTALTPDVATFQSTHSAGIVPKKAGFARFKVTCNDNPALSQIVEVLFLYERPLVSAVSDQGVYYAHVGDGPRMIGIVTNGQEESAKGASEQRFYWSYSNPGVARVTDSVHYDRSSNTIPNWFEHELTYTGEGVTYVTGTPYDTTRGCKPVRFKVVVSRDVDADRAAVERVENMINAIGEVTLEKADQIHAARAAFNALTGQQKGMVDDAVYAKLVQAELQLRLLQRKAAGEDQNAGGNTNPVGPPTPAPSNGGSGGNSGNAGQHAGASTRAHGATGGSTGTVSQAAASPAQAKVARASARPARASAKTNANDALREVDISATPPVVVQQAAPALVGIAVLALVVGFFIGFSRRFQMFRRERG